ncbi:precorrin-2 C(20)-methyltransferase [Heliobacterium gestii]|uniref:Precorrin-2 C(20)-methyltransferase n=1 Tax=Heliomicrobium gestii TaxID=2699 RepID=A0A845LH78_HELGE|nr:precorrin-2 C(20)-methyltransferase [Heliomicrobium gestii]MBM7868112.1 precorrin-2/cobalt-factor-2 C20-methyltransferase [Heliomicrobium gestii]MZP44360.1 precorrin-2 C(20)-methyltransferase [Heliomicrobium gestii]
MKGTFTGIGVGPGDPELLTFKAARLISEADVIIAPLSKEGRESTALRIVQSHIGPEAQVCHLEFPMTLDAEKLARSWSENHQVILGFLRQGKKVVFITIGDPMVYSTYMYMYERLKEANVAITTVPGITSFTAASCRAGVPLAEAEETITIIPATTDCENLDQLFALSDTLVLMKVYKNKDQIIDLLEKHGLKSRAVLISRCGLDGEIIETDLDKVRGKAINYLSIIIAKKEKKAHSAVEEARGVVRSA